MRVLRALRDFCTETGYRAVLLGQTFARAGDIPARRKLIADQMVSSGLGVLHVVLLVGLFMGMIVSLQTGIELARLGQQDQIGVIVAVSMAREMGPFITATILAATVGSSIAAELGTMAVSEELSALEVLSIDRIKLLVLPRVVALALMCPMLTIVCDTIGIVGGGLVAQSQLHVGAELYFDSAFESLRDLGQLIALPKDVFAGLAKAFVFGLIIAAILLLAGPAREPAARSASATRRAARSATRSSPSSSPTTS